MKIEEIKSFLSHDPILANIISRSSSNFEIDANNDIYLSLIKSIISQQLSVKAAKTIYNRFLTLFENNYPEKKALVDIDTVLLRSKGLSSQKSKYVKNIAIFFSDDVITRKEWDKMDNDSIINELTTIKGVGKWTVEMVLMFSLGRPDIFPVTDLGIQNGMKNLYQIDVSNKKDLIVEMEKIAERWKPYRSYASRYIWASSDMD